MREKLVRTVLSVLVVVGAVLAVRWTIRTAMARAYRAERDVGAVEMPVVPATRVWSLAGIVPKELHVNIAGLAIRRSAERLRMPYALAADLGLPEDEEILMLMDLGYAAPGFEPLPNHSRRKDLSETESYL